MAVARAQQTRMVGRRVAAIGRVAAVLAFYSAASVLLLGRHAVSDMGHVCTCLGGGGDPPTYMWSFQWWPHALTHGLNPLFTHVAWSPVGVNVAAAPMIPLPSMLLWPLSAAIGLLPTYDVLTLASPAVAATAMYLLCARITRSRPASLAGGWLYGFSSYELSELVGHANLMLIALLPLAVLLVLLRLDRRIGRAAFLAGAAAIMIGQLLTSSELLASSCAFGALAFAVAWIVAAPARRADLLGVLKETIAAGLLAALIASPYLYYSLYLVRPSPQPGASTKLVSDLAGLVVPTRVTLLQYAQGTAARLPGNIAEQGAYFGIPLICAFLAALWRGRRTPAAALLAAVAAVGLILSFGSRLSVAGHGTVPLPWKVIEQLRIANAAVPDRVVLFTWFALAVALAIWLAAPGRARLARWALVLAGIVVILPAASTLSRPDLPSLLSGSAYKRVLKPAGVVLALPYGYHGYSMLWQAETDFAFNMPEGNLSSVPPVQFRRDPTVTRMLSDPPLPLTASELRAFLRRYHVSTVIVDPLMPEAWPQQLAALGLAGRLQQGAIVYQVGAL
jgi:hypothetical protein